jgi:hypothetical protein
VVGHLSQSNATGRAFGHTKSRRLFSLLGGAERRAGIVVLPPRSTFPQTHSPRTPSRRQELPSSGIPPTGRSTSCILTRWRPRDVVRGLIATRSHLFTFRSSTALSNCGHLLRGLNWAEVEKSKSEGRLELQDAHPKDFLFASAKLWFFQLN